MYSNGMQIKIIMKIDKNEKITHKYNSKTSKKIRLSIKVSKYLAIHFSH